MFRYLKYYENNQKIHAQVMLINPKVYQICISSNINAGNILQNNKKFQKVNKTYFSSKPELTCSTGKIKLIQKMKYTHI